MTKGEFIRRASAMVHPVIEPYFDNIVLLSKYFLVYDKENIVNSFTTHGVRLLRREYMEGKLDRYYERERNLKQTLLRWLKDASGNRYAVKEDSRVAQW